jgi:predicted transcriptional regulator
MIDGKKIREKRERLKWTAEKLADHLGVGRPNIYKWEEGVKPSDPEVYAKLKRWMNRKEAPAESETMKVEDKPVKTVKSNGIAIDYKEKYFSLLEKYNSLLEKTLMK